MWEIIIICHIWTQHSFIKGYLGIERKENRNSEKNSLRQCVINHIRYPITPPVSFILFFIFLSILRFVFFFYTIRLRDSVCLRVAVPGGRLDRRIGCERDSGIPLFSVDLVSFICFFDLESWRHVSSNGGRTSIAGFDVNLIRVFHSFRSISYLLFVFSTWRAGGVSVLMVVVLKEKNEPYRRWYGRNRFTLVSPSLA